MSLKAFHVVFISASALLAFGFAYWCLSAPPPEAGWGRLAAGAAAIATGLGLAGYGARVLKKMGGGSGGRATRRGPACNGSTIADGGAHRGHDELAWTASTRLAARRGARPRARSR